MNSIVFLDLDRTLFRTNIASLMKWRAIGRQYPSVDGELEHARQGDFYVHSGDAYAYDFTAHLKAAGLNPAEVYDFLKGSEVADGRLEYDGVKELVNWLVENGEVRVLTYGIDDYQRLKAALCPSLINVEIITTLESKADFLKNKGEAWLVDDKDIGSELTSNVKFIQVDLEGGGVDLVDRPWPIVSSLTQVLELIKRG